MGVIVSIPHWWFKLSKMACKCGNEISDSVFPCETEAWLISEYDRDHALESASMDIASYQNALASGTDQNWLIGYFGKDYILDSKVDAVVHDILTDILNKVEKSISECRFCGRIWIQKRHYVNEYFSYQPDNGSFNQALRWVKERDV